MKSSKPIIAVGADHPLEDELLMADYFRKTSILMYLLVFADANRTRWN